MKNRFKNMSIFKKTILFSTFIVFIVGMATAIISFSIQSNATKKLLTDEAVNVTNLWKETLSTQDITVASKKLGDTTASIYRLKYNLNKLHEKYSPYARGYLLLPSISDHDKITYIAVSDQIAKYKLNPGSTCIKGKEFSSALRNTLKNGVNSSTDIYKNKFGTWITSLSPIKDDQGHIIAVLGLDVDATITSKFQYDLIFSLVMSCIVLFSVIMTIQERGLRKMLQPLKELIDGIHEVSTGNFNINLPDTGESEVGILRRKFNEMVKQLKILFDQVAVTSEQFGFKQISEIELNGLEKAIGEMDSIIRKTKLLKELQRAEKMNAIGQLAASVAHEIRNPMTVVKGFLQIFLSKKTLSVEEKEYIELMINEMNRAETIINDYLSLAKPDVEQYEKIDCSQIVRNVTELMSSYALFKTNIFVKIDVSDDLYVKGNKNELKQVLINIIKNGIEAMKTGGELSIKAFKDHNLIKILIQDTGIGMTNEELKRLGTPFYSLKEKGTGIGMMVCFQIIEQIKGHIEVYSEKGSGTTFIINIPEYDNIT